MKGLEPTIDPRLYQNGKSSVAETEYEVTAARDDLPFGIAIADIEQVATTRPPGDDRDLHGSQGSIEFALDDERIAMHVGEAALIRPGVAHSARSIGDDHAARITVTTIPELASDDRFPVPVSGAIGEERR